LPVLVCSLSAPPLAALPAFAAGTATVDMDYYTDPDLAAVGSMDRFKSHRAHNICSFGFTGFLFTGDSIPLKAGIPKPLCL